MEQYDSALVYAKRLLLLNPGSFNAYNVMGDYYRYTNNPLPAIENYRKALKYYGNKNRSAINGIYLWLGSYYCFNLNNFREGLPYFKICNDTSSFGYWLYLGTCFSAINDFDRAEKYSRRSFGIDSTLVSLSAYCSFLSWNGKYEESQKFLDKYCKPDARQYMCIKTGLYINIENGKFEKALKYLKELYNFRNQITAADSVYIAYLFKCTGNEKEADEIIERTLISFRRLSLNDTGPKPFLFTSFLYGIKGDKGKSLENLSKAIEIGPVLGVNTISYGWLDDLPFYRDFRNDIDFKEIMKREKDKAARSRAEVNEMVLRGETDL